MITRKVITSALLFILSFNWLGYDLVFSFMNRHLQDVARQNIDLGRYDTTKLKEIRVDLGLPYPTDWNEFEKVNGTVTVNGVVYEFVERKYEKGQMVYRVLPNIKSTRLPNFPSYISGHSTFSGAAAEVLGYLVPEEADRFSAMAYEASMSRLYGAIHYRSDCTAGLEVGRKVGTYAVKRAMDDGAGR